MRVSAPSEFPSAPTNVAHIYYSGQYCTLACETTINYVTFNDSDPSLPWKVNACRSHLRITSLYLCFDEFCRRDGAISNWIENQSPWCFENANVTLPSLRDVLDQWQPEDKAKVERLFANDALKFPSLDHLMIPDHGLFERAFTTVVWHPRVKSKKVMMLTNFLCRKLLTGNTKYILYTGKQPQ
jgi:hypothetical protein